MGPRFLTIREKKVCLSLMLREEELVTPVRIKIKSADFMVDTVEGYGFVNKHSPLFTAKKLKHIPMDGWKLQYCIGGASWYADKIGKEFSALQFQDDWYRINNDFGCGFFFIHREDFDIL